MDRRNNKLWRDDIYSMENEATEFDVYLQGTVRESTLRDRFREVIQLFKGASNTPKKISRWGDFVRDTYNTGKSILFQKRF